MDTQVTHNFEAHRTYRSRAGSPVAIEKITATRIMGAWYDGVSWNRTWWNPDGRYGLHTIPDELSGRGIELFTITPAHHTSLDIIPPNDNTPDQAA